MKKERDDKIIKLYREGNFTMRTLGKMFNVSYQRIGQITSKAGIKKKPKYPDFIDLVCYNCKNTYTIPKEEYLKKYKYRIERRKSRYFCSIQCYEQYKKTEILKKRHKTNCLICQKEISLVTSYFKRSKNHFCSRKCFYQYLRERRSLTLVCDFCNRKFSISKGSFLNRIRNRKYNRLFCSVECFNNFRKENKNYKISVEELKEWKEAMLNNYLFNDNFEKQ